MTWEIFTASRSIRSRSRPARLGSGHHLRAPRPGDSVFLSGNHFVGHERQSAWIGDSQGSSSLGGTSVRVNGSEITQFGKDLAFRVQRDLEEALLYLAWGLRRVTATRNRCLAGGVALNCVANAKIVERTLARRGRRRSTRPSESRARRAGAVRRSRGGPRRTCRGRLRTPLEASCERRQRPRHQQMLLRLHRRSPDHGVHGAPGEPCRRTRRD
jgi:hypothetical protein